LKIRSFDLIPYISANVFIIHASLKKFENRHTGRCYPSYSTLAKTTGLDKKTVIKYVDILVEYKLIDKRAQFIDGRQRMFGLSAAYLNHFLNMTE
jgi:DNA-binding MarR family transcriptional regulator